MNGCEQSGKSLSLKLQEWVKNWHMCDVMTKDIGDQNKELGRWNKHLTNIFLSYQKVMLVVYISFWNLSIILREYDCLEYSNKEGPSLKRATGIKCMRKSIF